MQPHEMIGFFFVLGLVLLGWLPVVAGLVTAVYDWLTR